MTQIMDNSKAMKFFEEMSHNAKDNPNSVKLAHNTDYTDIDANFILRYSDKNSRILDIATGTGLIVNKIYNKVGKIECIEPYEEFTKFIVNADNIEVFNQNIFDYETENRFDLITLFGFMHYVEEREAIKIYKKCYKFLNKGGKIIIKNQFGVKEDVNVAGYSKEQKTDYYAQYRYIGKELDILSKIGFKNIEDIDIYPPEANRWDNTHFYAIVGEK